MLLRKSLPENDVSPEKVLEQVKRQFKQNGPISGSWIHMEAESMKNSQFNYRVYKGGISKNNNGKMSNMNFIADASNRNTYRRAYLIWYFLTEQ